MNVLFVQETVFESYGTMMLSAVLRQDGHKTDILISGLEKNIVQKAKSLSPDVVCFSVLSSNLSWFLKLAPLLKKELNVPFVVGGPHPTFFPEIIHHPEIDFVCRGEGEEALPELISALAQGSSTKKIRNIWSKERGVVIQNDVRALITHLDTLPFADRTLYTRYSLFRTSRPGIIMASRGCPHQCSFCFNKQYNLLYKGKGRILRRRSVTSLIEELQELKKNKQVKHIWFFDDSFFLATTSWLEEFSNAYKRKIGLPFSIEARVDEITPARVRLVKQAGCRTLRIGIESANEHIRERILKKGITTKQIKETVLLIKKHKIKLQLYNIVGSPQETLATALETYALNLRLRPDNAWCSLLQPYPGTDLFAIASASHLLPKHVLKTGFNSSFFRSAVLKNKHNKEFTNLQNLFAWGISWRVPVFIMRGLIRVPNNFVYRQIFKLYYALGVKKLDNLSWLYLLRVGLATNNFLKKN